MPLVSFRRLMVLLLLSLSITTSVTFAESSPANVKASEPETSLKPGDIAFIGYNTGGQDGFAFIALKDLPAGETLYLTEQGWDGNGWMSTINEPHLSYIIPAGITCGTIVSFVETAPDVITVNGGGSVTFAQGSNFNLSGGDQILAYQSATAVAPANPRFIAGVHGDYNSTKYDPVTTWNPVSPNSTYWATSDCALPPGLTNGVDCISLFPTPGPEYANAKYNGTLTGTAAELRTAINTPSNWIHDNTTTSYPIQPANYPTPNVDCSEGPTNNIPVANDVTFIGTLQVGSTLTGDYDYEDADEDLEGATTFQWYRYDAATGGVGTLIAGATAKAYTLQTADEGKWISFEVTPHDDTEAGAAVESERQGPVAAVITPGANNIVYVRTDGVGDGSSWANATADLQSAIDALGVKEVWVASGTYNAPSVSFRMKNNVAIYGGFIGAESARTERNWNTNQTVLSGQGQNRVIHNEAEPGSWFGTTSVLDGFIVTDGYHPSMGGGMYNSLAHPLIQNVIFTKNKTDGDGGAIYNIGAGPTLHNVLVVGNEAKNGGGAIYGESVTLSTTCCGVVTYVASPDLYNVTLVDNFASEGAGVYVNNSAVDFFNCIVYGNRTLSGDIVSNLHVVPGGNHTEVRTWSSILEGSGGSAAWNPDFGEDRNGNLDVVPGFVDAANGDYTLMDTSPAINAGSNQMYQQVVGYPFNVATKDLAVNTRIYNLNSGTIDMGAYEYQGEPVVANTPPTASSVSISGTLQVGQAVNGTYNFVDADSDTESGSTFKWYRYDAASGDEGKLAIDGATEDTYTLQAADAGQYISFEVTPHDDTEAGAAVESDRQGPVAAGSSGLTQYGKLFFPNMSYPPGYRLESINFDGTGLQTITTDVTDPAAVAVDVNAGRVYWTDWWGIYWVSFDGMDSGVLLPDATSPVNLCFNPLNNRIYWTTGLYGAVGEIKSIKTDGTDLRVEISTGDNPAGMAGDFSNSKVYWARQSDNNIYWASLDDQTSGVLVSDAGTPMRLWFEPLEGRLYWASMSGNKIESIKSDGTDRKVAVTSAPGVFSLAVDGEGKRIYWHNLYEGGLYWSSFDGNSGGKLLDADGAMALEIPYYIPMSINTPPTASDVSVSGTAKVGEALVGDYTYADADNDTQGASTFKWYRYDHATGDEGKTDIEGATGETYTLQAEDEGKWISVEVTPHDGTETGEPVESERQGPVEAAEPTGVAAIYDFEDLGTDNTSFSSSSVAFQLTGHFIGQSAANFGSNSPPSAGYMDTKPGVVRTGEVGGLKTVSGEVFKLVGIDVWPSENRGDISTLPYGASIKIIGKRNGSQVAEGTYTSVTFNQTPDAQGGNWHRVVVNGTLAETAIDEFVIELQGTQNYMAVDQFAYKDLQVASSSVPIIATGDATAITANSATLDGDITADGGAEVSTRGIEYSTTTGFAEGTGTQVSADAAGSGTFTVEVSGLTAGTTYYYKAYATNSVGTAYGEEGSFTTFTGELITAEDIPDGNSGPFSKTIGGVSFDFTPAANNYVALISHMGNFNGLYAWDIDKAVGTEITISAPGHSFDMDDFKYISDAGAVELTMTLTFVDGTVDAKAYTLAGDSDIKVFTTYTTAADDVLSIKLVSDVYLTYNDFIIKDIKPLPANTPPTASDVTVSGTTKVGETLTGNYTYADADNDTQGASTFKWYRYDHATGDEGKTDIDGATGETYALQAEDEGKYISFEVTPHDDTEAGEAVESERQGPVLGVDDPTEYRPIEEISTSDGIPGITEGVMSISPNAHYQDKAAMKFQLSGGTIASASLSFYAGNYPMNPQPPLNMLFVIGDNNWTAGSPGYDFFPDHDEADAINFNPTADQYFPDDDINKFTFDLTGLLAGHTVPTNGDLTIIMWQELIPDGIGVPKYNGEFGGAPYNWGPELVITYGPAGALSSVITQPATAVTYTSATLAGEVTSDGGSTITARGIEYSEVAGFDEGTGTKMAAATAGTGIFTVEMTGIDPGTTIYYRAYATTSVGTAYGAELNFTTTALPANNPPTATNVSFSGTLQVDETLAGQFTYNDIEGDCEGTHTYRWFRYDEATGNVGRSEIAGASTSAYTIDAEDQGKYISFEVTPHDGYNAGASVESDRQGPVQAAPGVSIGADWTIQASAANNQWLSVTYGNGLFVAVAQSGSGNRVMTSPDGINWTARTSAADNMWSSVTYGNGLFVAVAQSGSGNRVMTSPDGINWTARTSVADNNWYSVTYGDGLFVAVAQSGSGNRVMTSPDGINWTARTSAANNDWYSVTYGDGLFVAVAYTGSGNRVMTSPDGINWTARTSAADNLWRSVTYGDGLFVAVDYSGSNNGVMTSPDGINWTAQTLAANNNWFSVTYGNGLFVAVSINGSGNRVMTSPDGINWTTRNSAADNQWGSVTYGDGLFVAVSFTGSGNRVMTSGVFTPPPANTPPTASDVLVSGTARVGETLTGDYTYTDADNDTQGASTFQWYRYDAATGDAGRIAVPGATEVTYTLGVDDGGKYISFEVTPHDGTHAGEAVESERQGPVAVPVVITPTDGILYVKKSASGDGSGSAWDNAIPELADALEWAREQWGADGTSAGWDESSPLQIWVAAGMYKPLYSPENGKYNRDGGRDNAFVLVPFVQLYGGFLGHEHNVNDRNWKTNETVLSGNIGNEQDATDNVRHVVISAGRNESYPINDYAVMDGFTITGGYASREEEEDAQFILNETPIVRVNGGGIFIARATPILANITVLANTATGGGGGIRIDGGSPTLTNVVITGNTSITGVGGGVYNGVNCNPKLNNVLISDNTAASNGGGIYNHSSSNPVLTNVAIRNNTAGTTGGGIYNHFNNVPVLTNVTIAGNSATEGGGIYNNQESCLPIITNSIIWGNGESNITGNINGGSSHNIIEGLGGYQPDIDPLFMDTVNGDYTLQVTSPAINAGSNEAYTDAGGDLEGDLDLAGNPRVYELANDGTIDMGAYEWQPLPNTPPVASYVIVVGTAEVGETFTGQYHYEDADEDEEGESIYQWYRYDAATGVDGRTAIDGATSKTYTLTAEDQGKYISFEVIPHDGTYAGEAIESERQGPVMSVSAIRYVRSEANGGSVSGDGLAWATASSNLQAMIDELAAGNGGEVWVAAGTYTPTDIAWNGTTDRDKAFVLKKDVKIYGGFPATGSPDSNDRNWKVHGTTLSGDLDNNDTDGAIIGDNAYHVVLGAGDVGQAVLDGFTITGGNADNITGLNIEFDGVGIGPRSGGGIAMINKAAPAFANLVVTGNSAVGDGAGIHVNNASPSFTNITVTNNHGGMAAGVFIFNQANVVLKNAVVSGNMATSGGGMALQESSPTLINVSVTGNTATNGAGLLLIGGSPVLDNLTVSGNAGANGAGIYFASATPVIRNSIIWGNGEANTYGFALGTGSGNNLIEGVEEYNEINGSPYLGGACGLFVDYQPAQVGFPVVGGDYSLKPSSPAINIGDNNLYPGGTVAIDSDTDAIGSLRLYGGTLDLGAFEFQHAPLANTKPVAHDVVLTGTLHIGDTLSGNYTFTDVDNDCDVTSLFVWYRADSPDGTNAELIGQAVDTAYVLTTDDAGKYLRFEVIPHDGFDAGDAVQSEWFGPVVKPVQEPLLTAPADSLYKIGDMLLFTIDFGAPIQVTGEPSLGLQVGDVDKLAVFTGLSLDANVATFTYTVAEGDLDEDGISLSGAISVGTGSIVFEDSAMGDVPMSYGAGSVFTDVRIDGIYPTVSGVDHGAYYNVEVAVTLEDGAIAKLNGSAYVSGTPITAEGGYKLVVEDAAGNVVVVAFTIDLTAPEVTGVGDGAVYTEPVTPVFTEGTATLNGEPFTSGTEISGEGEYTLIIKDDVGNTDTIRFVIDMTAPVVTGVGDGAVYTEPVTPEFTEGTATLNGEPFTSGTEIIEEGEYTLIIKDDVGNTDTIRFVIDMTAPEVTGVGDGAVYTEPVTPVFTEGTATLNDEPFTSGTEIIEEGEYTLIIKDDVGNTDTIRFVIDLTAPEVTGVGDGAVYTEPVTPVFTEGTATLNGEPFTSGTEISGEGEYTLIIKDEAGNIDTIRFVIDLTAPEVTGVGDGAVYTEPVTPEFTEGIATLNGELFTSGTEIAGEGEYTLVIKDDVGNTDTIRFVLDMTAPVVTGVEDGVTYTEPVTPVFTEGTATLNGEPFTSGTEITEEGEYTLIIKDDVGNTDTIRFVIDMTAPEVTGVEDGAVYTEPVTPEFTEGTATLNGEPFTSGTEIIEEGEYTLIIKDEAGNIDTIRFVIDLTAPEVTGVGDGAVYTEPVTPEFTEGTATLNGEPFTSGTEIIEEGEYTLIIKDDVGNTDTIRFVIDMTAPEVTGVGDGAVYTEPVTPEFTEGTATLNDEPFTSGTEIIEEGEYTLIIKDAAGNTDTIRFVIDMTAPEVTGVGDGAVYTGPVTPVFTEGTATLNGEPFTSGTEISGEGEYTLIIKDDVGNTDTIRFVIDMTAPEVTGVGDGAVYTEPVTPEFTEGTATLNGEPFTSGTEIIEEGEYTLIIKDAAGNTNTIRFVIDMTAPEVTGVGDGAVYTEPVTPEFTEGIATLNGELFTSGTEIAGEGEYTLVIKDDVGNTDTIRFVIDLTAPEVTGVEDDVTYTGPVTPVFTEGTATLNGELFTSGTEISGEGEYTLIIKDDVGNTDTIRFVIDMTAPVVTGVEDGAVYTEPVTPVFTEGTATLNGELFTSGTEIAGEGEYTLVLTDGAGNATTVHFTIDRTAPAVTGVTDGNTYNTSVTPVFTEGTATLNGEPFTSGTEIAGEGDYTLTVKDAAGNETVVRFVIDHSGVVIGGVIDGFVYNRDVTPVFTEGTATLNGEPFTSGTAVTAEGEYTLVLTDGAGNATTVRFTIDRTAPAVTGVTDGNTYNTPVTPVFTDGTATLNGEPFTSGTEIAGEGDYTLTVKDAAGNETVVRFVIDHSGVAVGGVIDGFVYNRDVTPVFNEGTATLNGEPFISGTAITEEGEYTLVLTDGAGNATTVHFRIDRTAPAVTGVTDGNTYNTSVTPVFTEGTATLNGEPFTSGTEIAGEGDYTLTVKDAAGNETVVRFVIDHSGVVIGGVIDGFVYNRDVTPIFTEGTATLNGEPFTSGTAVTAEGEYTLVFTDGAGNAMTVHFTIDRTAPAVTGVTDGNTYNTSVIPVFTEGTATLNGEPFTSGTAVTAEGEYTLVLTDAAGNATTVHFTIDRTAPAVTGVTDGNTYNTPVTPVFTDGTATLNGAPFTSGTEIAGEGDYTLTVKDAAGNETVVRFVIDHSGVVIGGVIDGFVYNRDVTPVFNEGTATLNGEPFTSGTAVTAEGEYTLVLTDGAGNATTVHFTIDRTAPAVTGVTDGNTYNTSVTPVFTEGTATLNGEPFTSGTEITAEGDYALIVKDGAGNETVVRFVIDHSGVVVGGVIDGFVYNRDVTPVFTEGTATLNGEAFISGTAVTAEGEYVLIITDGAGNSTTVRFTIDKTAPVVSGVEDGNTYNTPVTPVFTEGTATLNGEPFTSGTEITAEGDYVLIVKDGAGNETVVRFVIDHSGVVVGGVIDGFVYNRDVTPMFTEGTATLNGEPFSSGTAVTAEGEHTLIITDGAGNSTTVRFTIDKTSPVVIGVLDGNTYNTPVTPMFAEGTATLNGEPFTSGTEITAEGDYTLTVKDAAGNETVVRFVIDHSGVVIGGVIDGFVYNRDVTPVFTEGTATLNGEPFSSGTAVTAEGEHTLIITDGAGNSTTVRFTIDKTSPVVSGVEDGNTYNRPVTPVFTEGTATLNGEPFTSDTEITAEGDYALIVKDGAGNETVVRFVIDHSGVVVGGVIDGFVYNRDVTPVFTEGTATLNGEAFISGTAVTAEGEHTLIITDGAGNSTTVRFTIDKTSPVVSGVEDGNTYNTPVTPMFAEGTATLNGEPFTSGTEITAEGDYTLTVKDAAGNETVVRFVIDHSGVVIGGVIDGFVYNRDVTPVFTEGTATLNGEPFSSGTAVTAEGEHTLVITDSAGNATTVRFTIDKTAPVVTGVTNEAVYGTSVIPVFNEGEATLNGEPFTTGTEITEPGEYTLIVKDAAANGTTVSFTIGELPGAPTGLNGLPGNKYVTLDWQAPATGTLPVTDYIIEYSANGGVTWITAEHPPLTGTRVVVIGLVNNRSYRFRVAAVNKLGRGASSPELAGIIPTEPVPDAAGELPEPKPGETVVITDGKVEAVVLEVVDGEFLRLRGDGYALELASLGLNGERIPISAIDAVIRLIRGSGAGVYVAGNGFEPGTVVTVYLFSTPELVGHLPVGSDGRFAGTLPVPTHLELGNHTLQANGIVAGGLGERSVSVGLLLVDNKAQSIAFDAPGDLVYGAAPITLQATASSGLPVSYTVTDANGNATDVAGIVEGNRLHVHKAGTFRIAARQSGDLEYAPAAAVSHTVSVAKATLTVTATAVSKVYGTVDPALAYTHGGLVAGDTRSVIQGSLTREPGESVGSYGIGRGSLAAGDNYTVVFTGSRLTITPAVRSLAFGALAPKTYGDADFAPGAVSSIGEAVSYTSSDPAVAIIENGLIRIIGAGQATITATVAENGNYTTRPSMSQPLVVGKATQTITVPTITELDRDAGSVPLAVSSSSGLPVTLEVDDQQVAVLSGEVLNVLRLGTVTITATQAGDGNHHEAEAVRFTIRITDGSDFPVKVHKAVSPNGDGINEFLMIEGIRDFPENRVTIINRNGTVLYEVSGYDNGYKAFRGISTGQLQLSAGTYFYIVEVKENGKWRSQQGYFVMRY